MENQFLEKLKDIINQNLSNEQFGVSELAREIGMSRSNLLRKVKKIAGLSVSQFIREQRLKYALELLKENEFTVSEISYKVGFSSTSYFIKCFREKYEFSPGEAQQKTFDAEPEIDSPQETKTSTKNARWLFSIIILILVVAVLFKVIIPLTVKKSTQKKSIAVLPFINDSADSTNVYIVNGLMESILNNLQKIEGLRVISRTSVEKYRHSRKSMPELAKELNVRYIVEGSGQKIGNEIVLNIQLIEGNRDGHLWAHQYKRTAEDIFTLQNEVAKNIADEVKVFVSPDEEKRINKIPTTNPVAYDYFLQGLDLLQKGTQESARDAIPFFQKAIAEDENYARAHAAVAISYYVMEDDLVDKQFTDSVNFYADKALLLDSQLPQSLIAKALFYMNNREFEKAIPYFEKTLEFHPNNDLVLMFLVDLYANHFPDTEKYLQYVLMGQKLDITEYDSTVQSYTYLHLSNALVQSGFVDKALFYINKSISFSSENLFSQYVRAYVLYAKNQDLEATQKILLETFKKDTTRLDVMQEVAKTYFYQRDYQNSYKYYKPFYEVRKDYNLDIYHSEDIKIARVYFEMGLNEEAGEILETFKQFAENDRSLYKNMYWALYFAQTNNFEQCIEHLSLFSEQKNYHIWTVLFTPIDPVFEKMADRKEFKLLMKEIKNNFQQYHTRLRKSLEEKDLL